MRNNIIEWKSWIKEHNQKIKWQKETPLICQKERTQKQNLSTVSQNFGNRAGSPRSLNKILAIIFSPVILDSDSDHYTGGWDSISLKQNSHTRIS